MIVWFVSNCNSHNLPAAGKEVSFFNITQQKAGDYSGFVKIARVGVRDISRSTEFVASKCKHFGHLYPVT